MRRRRRGAKNGLRDGVACRMESGRAGGDEDGGTTGAVLTLVVNWIFGGLNG